MRGESDVFHHAIHSQRDGEAMKHVALIAAIALGLSAGAAAANEYHESSATNGSGYYSAQNEDGRWLVAYTGDVDQAPEEIVEFALRRAAEVAAEQNQEWFAVISATNHTVYVAVEGDLAARAGRFIGVSGPNRGTFGGELPPDSVLERWQPRQARQTMLIVQLGSGDSATFPGVTEQPQIFPAASQ